MRSSGPETDAGRRQFRAVVLAGSRPGGDPFAAAMGVPFKAVVPVAGVPMLVRVLRTLRASRSIDAIAVSGLRPEAVESSPPLAAEMTAGGVESFAGRSRPSTSVVDALERLEERLPVMVTTADHPLLSAAIVDDFCAAASRSDADVIVGVVPARLVLEAFPTGRRTVLRLRDDAYCTCNLFAFLSPQSRRVPAFWAEVEQHRKHPWRMVQALGIGTALRFLLRRPTLDGAMELASSRLRTRVRAVVLAHPEAGFDVDKTSDHTIAEAWIRSHESAGAPDGPSSRGPSA